MKRLISEIIVGERARRDYGDIEGLAKSIKEHGLIHPIVIDSNNTLVAGGRRLEACKALGWTEIEVKDIGEITPKKLRRIELEENIRRKDLAVNEYERSKQLVELAELVAEELREENKKKDAEVDTDISCEIARNPGRPKSENSIREMARSIGVPPKTLHDSQSHTKAVERYPELEELPKMKAIETAKTLDKLPEEERGSYVDSIVKTFNVIPSLAEKMKTMPVPELRDTIKKLEEIDKRDKEEDARIEFVYRIKRVYTDAIEKPAQLKIDQERIEAYLEDETREEIEYKIDRINDAINNLTKLQNALRDSISKPKLVKGGR